jgi:hypothetical protein
MTKIYGFEPCHTNLHPRGAQLIYRFDNGYGASVIPDHYDDMRELAVLRIEGSDPMTWPIDCSTPVTPHGVLRLNVEDIEKTLISISRLGHEVRRSLNEITPEHIRAAAKKIRGEK